MKQFKLTRTSVMREWRTSFPKTRSDEEVLWNLLTNLYTLLRYRDSPTEGQRICADQSLLRARGCATFFGAKLTINSYRQDTRVILETKDGDLFLFPEEWLLWAMGKPYRENDRVPSVLNEERHARLEKAELQAEHAVAKLDQLRKLATDAVLVANTYPTNNDRKRNDSDSGSLVPTVARFLSALIQSEMVSDHSESIAIDNAKRSLQSLLRDILNEEEEEAD